MNGFIELERMGYTGDLEPQNIAIVNGRAKFMRVSNSPQNIDTVPTYQKINKKIKKIDTLPLLRQPLQDLLENILGEAGNNLELKDFYTNLKLHPT